MELKATMKMYHDELEEAVSILIKKKSEKKMSQNNFRTHFTIRKMKNGNQP